MRERDTVSVSRPGMRTWMAALTWAALSSGCAPVFSDLQSARLVEPGQVEVTPAAGRVSWREDGESEHVQNQFGIHMATGLARSVDLRVRLESVRIPQEDTPDGSVWVAGAGPKFSLVRDRLAFSLPVGFAFGEDIEVSKTWAVHPTLHFTLPAGRSAEVNASAKYLIPLHDDGGDNLAAVNLGLALGRDVRRWAIRPEVGILFNPGEPGLFWHASLGFTVAVP